jgi:hypothetical protein
MPELKGDFMANVAFDVQRTSTAVTAAALEQPDPVAAIPKLYPIRRGLAAYYESLLDDPDEILRVAAVAALLDLGTVAADRFPHVVAMARYAAIKDRAFKYFMDTFEYELAQDVANTTVADINQLRNALMAAEITGDHEKLTVIHGDLFLAQGTVDHLLAAKRSAEMIGGWRLALPWALRLLLAQPADPFGVFTLLSTLADANQHEVIEGILAAFERAKLYPLETAIFGAKVLSAQGLHKEAIKRLAPTDGKINDPRLAQVAANARAYALAGDRDFRAAYAWYESQNAIGKSPNIDPNAYTHSISRRSRFRFPPLPSDPNSSKHLMMVGFPRSGTTLLENVLSAHPDIEAFEEIPALLSAILLIDRDVADGRVPLGTAEEARARYYREIRRRSRKPSANYFIDKLPLNSAQVHVTRHLFPEKKYIFAIRHPYDVALSCFKQLFQSNAAMENFRTISGTARLYDFVMTRWFEIFPFEDTEQVCYVRYEHLVTDFKATVSRVLRFIGVQWDEEVTRFAEHAEQRAAKTPSYQKVRSGLAIGLQTSWADYRFIFERKEAEPLRRWVERLAYMAD